MSKTPRGLGKGLGALLGDSADLSNFRKPVEYINKTVVTSEQPQNRADIMLIPVDMIEPNPFQPSQIISGERRFRASKLAGLEEIPAYIRDADDQGMLEMAIVENIQRENLDPIEIALSYQRLIDECSLTQEQMATRVGKKRASVTNYLRLLKLPAKVQHDLKVGLLSVGHAKVLLGIEDEAIQERLCDLVIREGLSVRQLEDRLRKATAAEKTGRNEEQDLPEDYFKVLEIVGKYFTNSISLKRTSGGKGTMTIHFSSDEEIHKFLNALEKSSI